MQPPPPKKKKKKKNQAQHIRRKLFSSVRIVILRSACRFSQLVISLKIMSLVNKKIGQGQAITLMYFCGVSGIDITGLVLSGLYSARHPPCQIDRQNFTIHFVQISP